VLSREQFCGHLGVALVDEAIVDEAAALTSESRDVLLANFVGGATNPVDTALGVVAVDIGVDVLLFWEVRGLLVVACQFQSVELIGATACKADFTVDRARCLAEDCLLCGDETSVTREVLTGPSAGLGGVIARL